MQQQPHITTKHTYNAAVVRFQFNFNSEMEELSQGAADIIDLSGDGGLLKKILSEGTGAVVQAGLKVDVEYYGA
jgi:hypothetical protein